MHPSSPPLARVAPPAPTSLRRRILLAAVVFLPSLALLPETPRLRAEPPAPTQTVEASRGPGQPYKAFPVRLLADLPGFSAAPDRLDRFGGDTSRPAARPTGFFRVERDGGRWWMIDPEGRRYFNNAVVGVRPSRGSAAVMRALAEKHGDEAGWARDTAGMLRELGFNGVGAWSDHDLFRRLDAPVPYTLIADLMADYARERKKNAPGGVGERFAEGVIPVFDPGFEAHARKRMRRIAEGRANDPWLVGVFTDNELPYPRDALDACLRLPENDHGRRAALAWRRARLPASAPLPEIGDEERRAFVLHIVDTYHRIAAAAVKEALPRHLNLGSRLHGRLTFDMDCWAAAARHVDVLSVNVYFRWDVPVARLREGVAAMGKPFLVTEWYAKGEDSGLPNTSGAGWLVRTQADRGRFYQHFLLGLLETGGCVGSHWFKYLDNDPADTAAGRSNIDSNKGLVDVRLEPYSALAGPMRELNARQYLIIRYFESSHP